MLGLEFQNRNREEFSFQNKDYDDCLVEPEEEAPYPHIPAELTTNDQAEDTPIPIRTVAEIEDGLHACGGS